ncbi:hypothetical protein OAQ01_00120 [Emcibacteraceae bacterium]|nr:hypothetical protein [Emcibacteraceae bacterium]
MSLKLQAEEEIRNAKMMNLPVPDIIPHPKHIIFDAVTQSVRILGPLEEKFKEKWNLCFAQKVLWINMLHGMYQMLDELEDQIEDEVLLKTEKKLILKEIDDLEQKIDKIREFIPDDIYIPPSTEEFCRAYLSPHDYEYDEAIKLLNVI